MWLKKCISSNGIAFAPIQVCGLLDGPVYKVEATQLVAPDAINASENDLRYYTAAHDG